MNKYRKEVRWQVAWGAAALLMVAVSPAAAEETVLAASKTRKLQVLTEGGAAWCQPTVRMRMVLEPDSPDVGNPASQVDIMNRLKTPITNDCKTARTAELSVVEQGKVTGIYAASADTGWTFAAAPAKAQAPAAQAPAVPGAEAPAAPVAQTPAAPAVAPAAPTVAPVAQAPVAQVPVAQVPAAGPPPLPDEINYLGGLLVMVKDNPAMVQDDGLARCWAQYRFRRDYDQAYGNEFKLQPLLQKARANLTESAARIDGKAVVVAINTRFEAYDFEKKMFPIDLDGDRVNFSRSCYANSDHMPQQIGIKIVDLDAVAGLPMEPDAAQAFAARRTIYSSINRDVVIAFTIQLDPGGFTKSGYGQAMASGRVESATVYADREATQVLHWFSPADMERLRAAREAEKAVIAKAEAERKAELARQALLAQRERNISALSTATTVVKLGNFISDADISYSESLDDLRSSRAAALVSGRPVAVSMLVQADGSGRSKVGTKWPGNLELTAEDGQPEFSASGWYLVRGQLSVPEGMRATAQLSAKTVYACTEPKCAEAEDATTIVDRKLAALAGAR